MILRKMKTSKKTMLPLGSVNLVTPKKNKPVKSPQENSTNTWVNANLI